MDLDPLFSATVVLLLARAVDARVDEPQWFTTSTSIVDEMISSGNQIAVFRKAEMQKMKELIDEFITTRHHPATHEDAGASQPNTRPTRASHSAPTTAQNAVPSAIVEPLDPNALSLYSGVDSDGQVDELSAQQILAVASSMDWGDIEWSFTGDNG